MKSKLIGPSKLSHTVSAFANTDGGELYIGISEQILGGNVKQRVWDGFADIEASNGHTQAFELYFPLGSDFQDEFMRCPSRPGVVPHVIVNRTQGIIKATDGIPYLRRGAQNLPQTRNEDLRRLEYTKGLVSFEGHAVPAPKELIIDSPITREYLNSCCAQRRAGSVVKKTGTNFEGYADRCWLCFCSPKSRKPKSQNTAESKCTDTRPTSPKGYREVLSFIPITVEGCLYKQIKEAVQITVREVEKIKRMGESGLEDVKYPEEALHEVITNAVIHRDYSIAHDVHVRIFDDQDTKSKVPVALPARITPANILNQRFARTGAIVRSVE